MTLLLRIQINETGLLVFLGIIPSLPPSLPSFLSSFFPSFFFEGEEFLTSFLIWGFFSRSDTVFSLWKQQGTLLTRISQIWKAPGREAEPPLTPLRSSPKAVWFKNSLKLFWVAFDFLYVLLNLGYAFAVQ